MIAITLITQSPLHLAEGFSVGPLGHTLAHVPGRTLRGALAQQYQKKHGHDADFDAMFLALGSRFGPLAPLGHERERNTVAWPLPLTARTCKQHAGFKSTPWAHGVRDLLFELMLDTTPADYDQCPECGAKLIPYQGYANQGGKDYRAVESSKRLATMTAIDSRRETAATAQLFSREVIEERQVFRGTITLADPALEAKLIEMLAATSELRLGGSRARFGRVRVAAAEVVADDQWRPPDARGDMATRLARFHQRAQAKQLDGGHQTVFALSLLSDAIVRDAYLRPSAHITPQYLGRYLDPRLAAATPLGAFAQTRAVDGWNAAHGLPRDTELVISTGSTFVFGTTLGVAELAPTLAALEAAGLGELGPEGFGRVLVNHPFHNEEAMR